MEPQKTPDCQSNLEEKKKKSKAKGITLLDIRIVIKLAIFANSFDKGIAIIFPPSIQKYGKKCKYRVSKERQHEAKTNVSKSLPLLVIRVRDPKAGGLLNLSSFKTGIATFLCCIFLVE